MKKLKTWQMIVLFFVGLALVQAALSAGVGIYIKSGIDSSNGRQKQILFQAQVSGCYRQNIRTIATNRNAKATFEGDKASISENRLFAGAVATPQPGASRKEQRLTLKFHTRLENSINRLGDEISTLTWTPVVVHCSIVPTEVELPVPFVVDQPPKVSLTFSKKITGGLRIPKKLG